MSVRCILDWTFWFHFYVEVEPYTGALGERTVRLTHHWPLHIAVRCQQFRLSCPSPHHHTIIVFNRIAGILVFEQLEQLLNYSGGTSVTLHLDSCDPGHPSAVALPHSLLLGYQECSCSRIFVSETQTEQEYQSLTVLMHGTSQDASWGKPTCRSQVQEQPCALCSLKINIPSSLRIPGLRCSVLKLEVVWDQSGKGWTQNCLHVPVERAVIPRKGAVCNLLAVYHSGMGREGRACHPEKYL